ncbi:hypothetical protein [Rhizorhapis suberifaciens]|uniref:Fungal lipase-like domain-containing protein n=1 Tax=Rhizorhapis suberifaciens TaxID=13656 RepID=A0A840HSG5_9SPHN|nr:hypothetical protein [Rhizorhapis suberifaciens]MBB4640567.1 hypothetical protein [Rhizorhapis suberifaciens]
MPRRDIRYSPSYPFTALCSLKLAICGDDKMNRDLFSPFPAMAYNRSCAREAFAPDSDIWNGWTLGGGFAEASQGSLALQFYEAVAGQEATAGGNTDIITTGHSLGGGLAGFVGALSGGEAVVFDHMPFLVAAVNDNDFADVAA